MEELYLTRDAVLNGKIDLIGSDNLFLLPKGISSQPPLIQSVAVPAIGRSAQLIDIATLGPGVNISIDPKGFISSHIGNGHPDEQLKTRYEKHIHVY